MFNKGKMVDRIIDGEPFLVFAGDVLFLFINDQGSLNPAGLVNTGLAYLQPLLIDVPLLGKGRWR